MNGHSSVTQKLKKKLHVNDVLGCFTGYNKDASDSNEGIWKENGERKILILRV